MIPVAEARARILAGLRPTGTEPVGLADALGRVLAEDVAARLTQPPADTSAMDGYAVRAADAVRAAALRVVGTVPAGGAFGGTVGPGEAVRIFTGAPVPAGADAIVIQEDTERGGETVRVLAAAERGRHIRTAGLDFRAGEVRLHAGRRLTARDIGLAAAMGAAELAVRKRPRVAILCTGDELAAPGTEPGPNRIVNSNGVALAAVVTGAGGQARDLGIVGDDAGEIRRRAAKAKDADLLVTVGGASVGEHDLVQAALAEDGFEVDFWKVAMRPGKPLIAGRFGSVPMLGVPGNPVSALVCALVFVRPAIGALLGLGGAGDPRVPAALGRDLPANGARENYLRSALERTADGGLVATPFERQDSAMSSLLAEAGCFVVRAPSAPAAKAGEAVAVIPFGLGMDGF